MRKDIEFSAEDGTTLRGRRHIADRQAGPALTIVIAHGFSGVKEMFLDDYAEAFAQVGLASLVVTLAKAAMLSLCVTAMIGSAQAQPPTPSHQPTLQPSKPPKLVPVLRRPLLTGLGCSLDAANGYSYRLVNTNTYPIPAKTNVTVYASKDGQTAVIHSSWQTSDPITPGDHLRVGTYPTDLGLITCWAITR